MCNSCTFTCLYSLTTRFADVFDGVRPNLIPLKPAQVTNHTMPFDEDGFYYHDFINLPTILEEEEGDIGDRPSVEPTESHGIEEGYQMTPVRSIHDSSEMPNAAAAQAAMQPLFRPVSSRRRSRPWPFTRQPARSSSLGSRTKRRSICGLWRKLFRRRSRR